MGLLSKKELKAADNLKPAATKRKRMQDLSDKFCDYMEVKEARGVEYD